MTADIIDITLPLGPDSPVYPGDPPVRLEPLATIARDGFALSRLALSTHAGTHIDPPAHFLPGGATVDALPLDLLIGPALLTELSRGRPITGSDLNGLPAHERLLLRTGGQPLSEDGARALVRRGTRLVGVDALSVDPIEGGWPVHHVLLAAGVVIVEGLALTGVRPGTYTLICLPLRLAGGDGAPARVVLLPPGDVPSVR